MSSLCKQLEKHPLSGCLLLISLHCFVFFLIEYLAIPPVIFIHAELDSLFPFVKEAVIPYCIWHLEIFAVLLFLYCQKDRTNFLHAVLLLWFTMFSANLYYLLTPCTIGLRPAVIEGKDFCSLLIRLLFKADPNRNVCPSLHVAIALDLCYLEMKVSKRKWHPFFLILCALIILSTPYLKQHSVVDVFFGFVHAGVSYLLILPALKKYPLKKK